MDDDDLVKCRIFRPWDYSTNKGKMEKFSKRDNDQDSTISTTTEIINVENISAGKAEKKESESFCDLSDKKTSTSAIVKNTITTESKLFGGCINVYNQISPVHSQSIQKGVDDGNKSQFRCSMPIVSEYLPPLNDYLSYPDIVNPVSSMDSVFSDLITGGYNFDEYARVLNQEHQTKLLNARKQRPKKYKCPHCDVGFSNNGQLKGHVRIHTGERPFRCDEKNCGKTFTRNEELTRHKRIHSGLRPFPCTHCGKRFGRKDHLKKHSRTHFQPREIFAVPVVLPFDVWTPGSYNYMPLFGY